MPDRNTSVPARLTAALDTIRDDAPGMSPVECRAFLFLADNEGASQRDVREHLGIPQATASRVLHNLDDRGFDLIQCQPKGRQHELRMSPKGRQLLARLAMVFGCCCLSPAASSILSQFEIEPSIAAPAQGHGYDACMDPTVFSCDVS